MSQPNSAGHFKRHLGGAKEKYRAESARATCDYSISYQVELLEYLSVVAKCQKRRAHLQRVPRNFICQTKANRELHEIYNEDDHHQ